MAGNADAPTVDAAVEGVVDPAAGAVGFVGLDASDEVTRCQTASGGRRRAEPGRTEPALPVVVPALLVPVDLDADMFAGLASGFAFALEGRVGALFDRATVAPAFVTPPPSSPRRR